MNQRLALQQILQNQIRNNKTANTEADVELTKITKQEMAIMKSINKSHQENSSYFDKKPDMKSIFDNIVSNIHSTMKTSKPPLKSVPTVPAALAEIPDATSLNKRGGRRVKGGQHKRGASLDKKKFTIPGIKALIGAKQQQMMRRGLVDLNANNFAHQRSIRDMLQQKSLLQNMLLQHKRLQQDRTKIALDLQRMRQELDKIHNKLETSWQSLHNTETMYGGVMARKAQPAKQRGNNSVVRKRDNTRSNASFGRVVVQQRHQSRPSNQSGGNTSRRLPQTTSKKSRVRKFH